MSLTASAWTLVAGAVFGLALAAPPGPMNAVIAEESVLRGWVAGFTAGLGAMTADFVFFVLSLAGVVAFLDSAPTVRAVMVGVGGLLMLYFAYGAVRDLQGTFVADGGDPDEGGGGGDPDEGGGGGGGDPDEGGGGGDPDEGGGGGGDTGWGDGKRPGERSPDGEDRPGVGGISGTDAVPGTRGFRKALVLALTNPYQILFWLTVGVGLLQPGQLDVLAVLPVVGADLAGVLVVRTGRPALLVGLFAGIVVWIVGFPATLVRAGRRVDAFAPTVAALSALVLVGFGVTFLWSAGTTLL